MSFLFGKTDRGETVNQGYNVSNTLSIYKNHCSQVKEVKISELFSNLFISIFRDIIN